MDTAAFVNPSGTLVPRRAAVSGRQYWAFVPDPLPPSLDLADVGSLAPLLAEASQAFGMLSGAGRVLPNPDVLVSPYLRREAIMSSRIENTHASFSDLAAFEATQQESPASQARDVHNYVLALEYGLRHVRDEGFTLDLIRRIHRLLMAGARGERLSTPGEFRTMQNHIGETPDPADAHFVPPPPDEAMAALEGLIEYLSRPRDSESVLIEAAWMHYQFETIHPFLDGNGRVGRVLIPLLFSLRGEMEHPLLYLSPYFETDRAAYYDALFGVSTRSEWTDWLRYFLAGVADQARVGARLAGDLIALGAEWRHRLDLARASRHAHRLAEFVQEHSAVDAKTARLNLGVSPTTAYAAIKALVDTGILEEYTGRNWGQLYIAPELRDLMESA